MRIRKVLWAVLILVCIIVLAVPGFLLAADTTTSTNDKLAELVVAILTMVVGYILTLVRSYMDAKVAAIKDPETREKAKQGILYAADFAELSGEGRLGKAAEWIARNCKVSLEKANDLARAAFQDVANDARYPGITTKKIRDAAAALLPPAPPPPAVPGGPSSTGGGAV